MPLKILKINFRDSKLSKKTAFNHEEITTLTAVIPWKQEGCWSTGSIES